MIWRTKRLRTLAWANLDRAAPFRFLGPNNAKQEPWTHVPWVGKSQDACQSHFVRISFVSVGVGPDVNILLLGIPVSAELRSGCSEAELVFERSTAMSVFMVSVQEHPLCSGARVVDKCAVGREESGRKPVSFCSNIVRVCWCWPGGEISTLELSSIDRT